MKYTIILFLSIFTFLSSGNLSATTAYTGYQNSAAKTQATTKSNAEKPTKKPADARTKTGDKIDHSLKGPKGETVYSGPKGGKYYLGKNDAKIYLKKE